MTSEELALAHSRHCFEPLFSSPFRITRDFVASLVNDMRHMKDAVLLKTGADNPAATAFVDFLKTDEAKAIIAKYGYGLDAGA